MCAIGMAWPSLAKALLPKPVRCITSSSGKHCLGVGHPSQVHAHPLGEHGLAASVGRLPQHDDDGLARRNALLDPDDWGTLAGRTGP